MPELPEVETVLRTLEKQIKDLEIKDIEIYYPKISEGGVEEFRQQLIGQHFRHFMRRGKYLLFQMDDCILSSHLRMEGKYYLLDEKRKDKHSHISFKLSDNRYLVYQDTRKFGRMEVLPLEVDLETYHHLGYEPWDERVKESYIKEYCKNRKIAIKTILLEQNMIAGIGNIYADEILFACGIRPGRSCQRLTKKDRENIILETRRILKEAIEAGGTTIRSYTSSLGVTGRFQLQCKVHTMKVCSVCKSDIKVKW
ncbi:MAG: DNA-formamidopyrimidine glycosylase, partial [Solobacterium sp.]|nr:DNA-formamidopyrimidine glycosylase [Solobacterium sp.]